MRIALIPVAALGLIGAVAPAAPAREDPLARELAGRAPGKAVDCLDKSRADGPQIVDERTLIYRESGRRIWKNDLPEACRGMRPLDTLVIEMFGSQVCRNDHFRSYSSGSTIPGAICRLGSFTPYDKPARR